MNIHAPACGRTSPLTGETRRVWEGDYAKLLPLTELHSPPLNLQKCINSECSDQIAETKKPGVVTGLFGQSGAGFLFRR